MNTEEYLLVKVSEECSEVAHRCSKALCFTMDEIQAGQGLTNKERILQEFNDLVATMELLFDAPVDKIINKSEILRKQIKVSKYMKYSRILGALTD